MRRHPERVEQAGIVRLLRTLGCKVWVLGTTRRRGDHPGTMQTPGVSDVLAFLPRGGGLLAVEAKAAGGKLRPEQEDFRAACLACEAPFLVHHVVGGLNDVIAYLLELGLLKADNVPHYRLVSVMPPED